MRFSDYDAAEKANLRKVIDYVVGFFSQFVRRPLTDDQWYQILATAYPTIEDARYESARIARDWYDYERAIHLDYPADDASMRHDTYLANYELEWFVQEMEDVREDFIEPNTDVEQAAPVMARVIGLVEREVSNGGRETLLDAVESDPAKPRFARISGGNESCGWCTMLISRGAVYRSSQSAGQLQAWHPHCDCRVVPVFDKDDYPEMDQTDEALRLYRKAQKQRGNTMTNLRKLVEAEKAGNDDA